jgi:hypothetical protein
MARPDDAMRLVTAENGDGICACQAARGLLNGLEEVAAVEVIHKVGDDFGVSLAGEYIAGSLQFGAQLIMILDDAVVHKRDAGFTLALAGKVRVGVMGGWRAMSGPAGVGNAGKALDAFLRDLILKFGDAMGAAGAAQLAVGVHGNAAGIIATVFEALEAFEKNGGDVALRNRADDTAHKRAPAKILKTLVLCAEDEEI